MEVSVIAVLKCDELYLGAMVLGLVSGLVMLVVKLRGAVEVGAIDSIVKAAVLKCDELYLVAVVSGLDSGFLMLVI